MRIWVEKDVSYGGRSPRSFAFAKQNDGDREKISRYYKIWLGHPSRERVRGLEKNLGFWDFFRKVSSQMIENQVDRITGYFKATEKRRTRRFARLWRSQPRAFSSLRDCDAFLLRPQNPEKNRASTPQAYKFV